MAPVVRHLPSGGQPGWMEAVPVPSTRRSTASTRPRELLRSSWRCRGPKANTGIAYAFGSLWVSNFTSDTVWRVNTQRLSAHQWWMVPSASRAV